MPATLLDALNLDVFLAFVGYEVVGTVTVIHQGDTSGIWSMATDTTRQRSGIGRRLLSTAETTAQLVWILGPRLPEPEVVTQPDE